MFGLIWLASTSAQVSPPGSAARGWRSSCATSSSTRLAPSGRANTGRPRRHLVPLTRATHWRCRAG